MSFRDHFKRLTAGSFLRDIAMLSFGTIGGRLIALVALPFVSRLYSPADFALLAIYLALVNTIAVAACLRLEIAIPLAETDGDSVQLLGLSLLVLCTISFGVLMVALLAPGPVAGLLGKPQLAAYLWLVPFGVLMSASYSALQYWTTRSRRFASIARTRVTQAVMGVITMLGLGWMGAVPLGLLVGYMFSGGAGGMRLGIDMLVRDRPALRSISWPEMKAALHKYRRYPIYSTPEALANAAGVQVPILLIAAHSGAEAGHLLFAMTVMAAPMALLGQSISQVYMSRAAAELTAGGLAAFTSAIMRRLFAIGSLPIALSGLLAPWVFPLLFGPDWARAGVIVAWIAPWMLLQLAVSPVSMALYVVGWQRASMVLQIGGVLLRVGSVSLAVKVDPSLTTEYFALSGVVFYAIYSAVVMVAVRKR